MTNQSQPKFRLVSFFSLWLISSTAYMIALGALMDTVPPRLEWISKIILPATLVMGFFAAVVSSKRNQGTATTIETIAKDGVVTIVGAAILIVLYAISIIVSPNVYATETEIATMLAETGLNPVQVYQIEQILLRQGYITLDDIKTIGLNPQQIRDMEDLLNEQGYVKNEQVVEIVKTQNALVATQTAVAKETTCFVEPELNYNTVAIRQSPSPDASYVGCLVQGENLHVIGHNGGRVNQDRWWLVEVKHGDSVTVYGWVASWVVKEINELECVKVTQSPGN